MPDDPDAPQPRRVPHPDDRLWRHPSELRRPPAAAPRRPGRPSGGALLAAGAAGAVVAVCVIALTGSMSPRVVERSGRAETTTTLARADAAEAAARSVARVEVERGGKLVEGSAVVVRAGGVLATSAALVSGGGRVRVTLADGHGYDAEVLGTDGLTGLAAIAVDATGAQPAVPASTPARPGDTALSVAAATGGAPLVTLTAVQAVGTGVQAEQGWVGGLLQLDRPLPGPTDGGALVGPDGGVSGVCLRLATGGWAVPYDIAADIVTDLADHGVVSWPWLGVYAGPAPVSRLRDAHLRAGVVVTAVAAGGPADRGGVRAGDLLTAVDDDPVGSPYELHELVAAHRAGHSVDVTVVDADGKTRTVAVILAPRPS